MQVVLFSAKNCERALFGMRWLVRISGGCFRGRHPFLNDHSTEGVSARQEDRHGMA